MLAEEKALLRHEEKVFLVRRCVKMFRDLNPNNVMCEIYKKNVLGHQHTHIKVFLRYVKLICKRYKWDFHQLFEFVTLTEHTGEFDSENVTTIVERLDYASGCSLNPQRS